MASWAGERSRSHEATFVSFTIFVKQIRDASWCSWHEGTESGFKGVGWGGSGGWGGAKQHCGIGTRALAREATFISFTIFRHI